MYVENGWCEEGVNGETKQWITEQARRDYCSLEEGWSRAEEDEQMDLRYIPKVKLL